MNKLIYSLTFLQVGFATIQKQKLTQLLPPDLKKLADGISQNRFLNMPQFHISKDTHLNTVSIAGLICHVAVFLQYAQDNEFLKLLTLIHYDPSALQGKCLPALPHDLPSVNNTIIHILGDPLERGVPAGIR